MANIVFTFVIFCLYVPLFNVGRYPVSLGTISAGIILTIALHKNRNNLKHLALYSLFILYPLVVYAIHLVGDTEYAIPAERFGLSYALWVVSITLVWSAFQARPAFSFTPTWAPLILLLALGALQHFGTLYLGTTFGYDIVAPIVNVDLQNSYVHTAVENGRAIGPYYEPSMFGRVVATLATMQLVATGSLFLSAGSLLLAIAVSSSFGLLVLGAISLSIRYVRSLQQLLFICAIFGLGALLFSDLILRRMDVSVSGGGPSSTYVRLIAPINAVIEILSAYPIGVPIGSNELVVARTLTSSLFLESKITNGLYEFLLYFGDFGLLIVLIVTAAAGWSWAHGRTRESLVAAYALLSVMASSSYLSIESSLLLYFFIRSMRANIPIKHIAQRELARQPGLLRRPGEKAISDVQR